MWGFTIKQPFGVVGAILPWNVPVGMFCWKVGAAVAAGNTVVVKSSEKSPLSVSCTSPPLPPYVRPVPTITSTFSICFLWWGCKDWGGFILEDWRYDETRRVLVAVCLNVFRLSWWCFLIAFVVKCSGWSLILQDFPPPSHI